MVCLSSDERVIAQHVLKLPARELSDIEIDVL
jgi:hypothetical protein